ncbi:MAG: peptidase family protein [Thermoleophilia bacterium]|nr:peptidase family protein [Thermoleophilia bacterium]
MLNATGKIIIIMPEPRNGGSRHLPPVAHAPHGNHGSTRHAPQPGSVDPVQQQQLAEHHIADVRRFFSGIGVTEREGNASNVPVVFDPSFENAAYVRQIDTRTNQMVGESLQIGVDPESGESYAKAKDVMAHEWTHRITNALVPGLLTGAHFGSDMAIGESLADTLAAAYDTDDWDIGEDIGTPVRNMADPGRYGDPAHMTDLKKIYESGDERVQVVRRPDGQHAFRVEGHLLAGIPNKAASLIGDAIGRDKMAQIYLDTARNNLQPCRGLDGYAAGVMMSARDLFGPQSREFQATTQAFDAVGLLDQVKAQREPSRR